MADDKGIDSSVYKNPVWKVVLALLIILAFVYFFGEIFKTNEAIQRYKITYTQFSAELKANNVKSVTIRGLALDGEFIKSVSLKPVNDIRPRDVKNFRTFLPSFQGSDLIAQFESKNVAVDVEPEESSAFWQIALAVLPWVIIIGVWVLLMRRMQSIQGGAGGGLFSFGQSKAKLFDAKKPSISFKDVAGMEYPKKELEETVEFMKDPSRFSRLGAKIPKGILLIGPPGTGKTLLARATAGEAGVPFFSISASEFIEMFVGVGASRVRDLFKRARDMKPSIIFIDEIDSIGRTRGTGLGGGHDEREQTLNQLLSEMDGFEPHEEIIVISATNRPDVLDPALLRPGRFDRHIIIDRPGRKDRLAILTVHLRNKKVASEVNLDDIAKGTPGMTGADLENLVNEAALQAARDGKDRIYKKDFEDALDKILMGTKREESFSAEERKITAYHEAGHALVSFKLPYTDPIHKVSIIPRGISMGVTQFLPEEDRHYYPKKYLVNKLSVALAGRASEKLVFKDVSSGAQEDLKNATSLAEKMVAQWGMSEKVGPVSLGRGEEHPFLGRELAMPKRYSEDMAWIMDQEIRNLIVEAESKADELLNNNRSTLESLAQALLKDETLNREDVERIIKESESGARKHEAN